MSKKPSKPIIPSRCKFPFMSPENAGTAGCLCPRCRIAARQVRKQCKHENRKAVRLASHCKFPALPLQAAQNAGCLCPRCLPAAKSVPPISNPTNCLYPHLEPKQAHSGSTGKSGCRCVRCREWSQAHEASHSSAKQAQRAQELLIAKGNAKHHEAERRARRPRRESCSPKFDPTKTATDRNRVYQNDWLEWQAETAAEAQRRHRLRIGQTEKIADLAKRADDYAWRVRSAVRERCRLLGITVTLTLAESQHELEIYKQCFLRTESTRTPHHVDHRVPLSKGGEHHPNNLQILTATENRKKGNRILP